MKSKICATCKEGKKENDFNWKDADKGLRHYVCKSCHALYRKDHYKANRTKYIKKAKKWNKKQRQVLREVIFRHLQANPCIDCGEDDIVVLDFDHRSDKRLPISQMFRHSYSVAEIMNEIGKCDVRCANCHRRKTARVGKHWRFGYETKGL